MRWKGRTTIAGRGGADAGAAHLAETLSAAPARAALGRPPDTAAVTVTNFFFSTMQLASSCCRLRHRAGASSSACRINTPGVSASRLLRQRDVTAGEWTPTAALSLGRCPTWNTTITDVADAHAALRRRAPRWGAGGDRGPRWRCCRGRARCRGPVGGARARRARATPPRRRHVTNVRPPPAARVVILPAYRAGASSSACRLTVLGVGASRLRRQRDVTTGGRTPTSTSIPTTAPAPAPVTQEPT